MRARRKKKIPSLSIVYRDIVTLRSNPQNPRVHQKRQVEQIAKSIESFGFNVPLLVNSKLQLIAGHGRFAACKLLGIQRVPTICLEHLNDLQLKAFVLADNKLAENASWDERLLAEQLKALSEVDLHFDIEAIGFEVGELDVLIESLAPAHEGEEDPADTLPEVADVRVSRPGDLWQLGNSRVLCGDALKEESYRALMAGQLAHAVFTDPPYNDKIDQYVAGFGKIHYHEFAMASGEMDETEFTAFLLAVFSHLARNSEKGSLHYIFVDWRHVWELLSAGKQAFTEFMNLCIWDKGTGGQGSFYRSEHELVFVFKSGREKHRNNIQLGQYGRYRTNVWHYRRVNSFGRATEEGNIWALHPTVKPVALVADAIMDCTARGEFVLDPFLGSGTTVIAAERTGRTCYGIELEPRYIDTIVRRWQAFTGQTAIHVNSGRSFTDCEEVSRGR